MLDMWDYYLPYLYSGISLCGVLLLLCKWVYLPLIENQVDKLSHYFLCPVLSMYSLWTVSYVQCNWKPVGQTKGMWQCRRRLESLNFRKKINSYLV